jgi:hypothetical protein
MKRHHRPQQSKPRPNALLSRLINGGPPPTKEDRYKAALAGDLRAGRWLLLDAIDGDELVDLAVRLCRDKAALPVFRDVFLDVWDGTDHRFKMSRELLVELFEYAAFEPPAFTPEWVTLWRGTAGQTVDAAKQGYFWTLDPEVAVSYAHCAARDRKYKIASGQILGGEQGWAPLLLSAKVHRSKVALFSERRLASLREAILLEPPEHVEIESMPENWEPHETETPAGHNEAVFKSAMASLRKEMEYAGYWE